MTKLKSLLIAMLSLAMILCTALFIGMPLKNKILTAQAEDVPLYVTVNGYRLRDGDYLESNDATEKSTDAEIKPANYVAWYKDGVLTLNGYDGGHISAGGDLTIKLKGENTITSASIGIQMSNCEKLIIDADNEATLNINVLSTEDYVIGISAGFGSEVTGNVTITGRSKVNIGCQTTNFSAYGIYSKEVTRIEYEASLDIKCVSQQEFAESVGRNYGIYSGRTPVFNTRGTIKIDTSECATASYCVYSAGNVLDLQNGDCLLKYKKEASMSVGLYPTMGSAPDGYVMRKSTANGETVLKKGVAHTVTVKNGNDYFGSTTNQYVEGEIVSINTEEKDLEFKKWIGEGVTFTEENATKKETSFVMPAGDVTVTADYNVFLKQPVFKRKNDTNGSVSFRVANEPYGNYYCIKFIKESGEEIKRSFSKDETSEAFTYYFDVGSFDFGAGNYMICVEYGGYYFYSEPFEIDYSEKEPDKFNIKITDGTAEVGGSTISSAKKGETVTITASNKKGFVFKAWDVVSGGVTLDNANSATTTFVMPESNVEIKATYKQLISFVEATVTEPVDGETIDTTAVSGNALYKVSQVKWRDVAAEKDLNVYSKFVKDKQYSVSVKFQVTSFSDYAFDKENAKAKINGCSAEIESVDDSFITIKCTFTATLPKYTITIENGTLEDGNTSGEFEEGEKIKVIAAAVPEGKAFVEWVIVTGDGYFYNDSSATTTFEMADSDVTIKAVYKTIVSLVELTVKTPVAGAVADNDKDLSYPTDKGYTATLIWYDKNWVKLSEGATFELGVEYLVEIEVNISGDYVFMTGDDTKAYLNGVEKSRSDAFLTSFGVVGAFIAAEKPVVCFDVKVTGGRAEIDEDIVIKAEAGKEITIIAEPAEGQTFEKWEVVSGGVTLANANSATTTFVMGNSNVEIKAVYKTVHVHTFILIPEKTATCVAPGMKKHYICKDCSKLFDVDDDRTEITDESIIIAINPNAHNLATEWTAAKEGHYHVCKNVGCAVGHDEIQAHTPDRAEATETEPVKCTVCDYTITPVVGHTHNLTLVPETSATCTENGTKSHYICADCGHKFADSAAENEITDESTLTIRMAHSFGEWIEEVPATTESIGVKGHKDCEFCHKHFDKDGNEIEDLTIAKLPGGGGSIEEPTENKGLSGGAIAGIVVGSVVVAGVGGFSIFWFVIKKKSFAELIAIFKKK